MSRMMSRSAKAHVSSAVPKAPPAAKPSPAVFDPEEIEMRSYRKMMAIREQFPDIEPEEFLKKMFE